MGSMKEINEGYSVAERRLELLKKYGVIGTDGEEMVPVKEFVFEKYEDFEKEYNTYHFDECCKCHGICELAEEDVLCTIEDIKLHFTQIFVLRCKKCGEEYLPKYTKRMIASTYSYAVENNQKQGEFTPKGYREKFDYCSDQDYKYDHRDYYNIPGLCHDDEHSVKGFLTPVYFEKDALVYFLAVPEYEVEIFSETYGSFAKIDSSGDYQYDWAVPFGFNTNGKLVMWLGDISYMDDKTKAIIKAFNVESDHLLTDSEFYQAQMKCIFSQPIIERRILLNKKSFIKNIKKRYQIDLSHLEDECLAQEEKINRPVVFTEQAVSEVINAYDKILVEGLDVTQLRLLYERLYSEAERDPKYKKWQSIKLIEAILCKLGSSVTNINIASVMSPLYILHDYRIYFDHLLSGNSQSDTKQHIVDTLGVSSFECQEEIYNEEIKRLNTLFNYLAVLSK